VHDVRRVPQPCRTANIDYNGVSGPVDLNDTGSVGKATIGIQLYGPDSNYKRSIRCRASSSNPPGQLISRRPNPGRVVGPSTSHTG